MPETQLDTFPRLLLHHAAVRPNQPAIREKDLGIWQTWTWGQVANEVRALACGLALPHIHFMRSLAKRRTSAALWSKRWPER